MIKIELKKDRTKGGKLMIKNKTFQCYGKSDNVSAAKKNNPTRDPLKLFGDTPTGTYKCYITGPLPNPRTYGPHKVIYLNPTSGDALKAQKNGRSGLLIHGGALGKSGGLRPTFGCIRVTNDAMKEILSLISDEESIHFKTEIIEVD